MIHLPRPADYTHSGLILSVDEEPCVICGRGVRIRPGTAGLWCGANSGIAYLPGAEAETARRSDAEDDTFGLWPIGANCLRRHPVLRPYIVRFH